MIADVKKTAEQKMKKTLETLKVDLFRRLDKAEKVKIYVGGLPRHPEPPLNYQIVYSLEGALDYYTTTSWILRDRNGIACPSGVTRMLDGLMSR